MRGYFHGYFRKFTRVSQFTAKILQSGKPFAFTLMQIRGDVFRTRVRTRKKIPGHGTGGKDLLGALSMNHDYYILLPFL